jgi:hypothetical protein
LELAKSLHLESTILTRERKLKSSATPYQLAETATTKTNGQSKPDASHKLKIKAKETVVPRKNQTQQQTKKERHG